MYRVKGTIKSIREKKVLDNGAVVLDYILEETSENGYTTAYALSMYKKPEYAEHIDNFIEFNKVGDNVEVEFTIRSSEYNGKTYNNLNHWRIEKLNNETAETPTAEGETDDLPF